MADLLSVVGLEKSFKQRKVVSNVTFQVRRGEIVGLLGPNGAGKTTTFYMIVGLLYPDAGEVYLDDVEITSLPMHHRARLGLGYLPQEASVFRSLTVEENLRLILEEQNLKREDVEERASRLMAEFGLQKISDVKGHSLSGGERRRVEIARALAIEPDFLMLDEPFSGIDPIAVYDIQQMTLGLRHRGYGIILTDHNVRETLAITDRACIIHEGQILVEGDPDMVAESEIARKYYLGERFSW
ncbi:MAG: LPS export ABC transporter ATP-binding protein [Acetomicrobium sp.]|jgi:lipopolysaccharide export system ATP-binding protein|uniref:LPS export ABC transporter ATP-binding protein n=1 Tax=Acetomicrobium TaxID=49894 RepID=UPI001690DBBD|nr:LPS export ABC transporter ATP-binding protein [Acetomicrobium mobile]MBP8675021.1 LPS export ABC transporter ATP-binding protein [Acetomicrobium sp.]MDI9376733.1 LPS export ABC transporter ATP-binding protein [Synergistota bacterium]NLI42881.1 LPS export ABC transporter ATP-binding protein [Synergistaceae bacterium]HOB10740.1 LPS export ABC transporter ATP-binding protein [Acetomicrobium sp.]HOM97599.1 LPS export ABC transporter ATP-binding protein [Acetomicrobium sp.]